MKDLPLIAGDMLTTLIQPHLQGTNLGGILVLFETPAGAFGLAGTHSHAEHGQILQLAAQASFHAARQQAMPLFPVLWRPLLLAEA